uniref:Orf6 n=1 Tax=Candida frijolesensis TaxID=434044 RepID=F8RHP9_9ASCO|nr:orf6 [Candida frijolesensis]ADK72539.1 orf6 [Candida frijolesensis]
MKENKINNNNNKLSNITINTRKPRIGKKLWVYNIITMKLVNNKPYNSISECNRDLNIERKTINKYINNNKIYKYKYIFSNKLLDNNILNQYNINISDKARQVIIGELLGDGHLHLADNNQSARLEWAFSIKALPYVNYLKFNILKELCNDTLPTPYPKDNPRHYWFSTKFRPDLLELHKKWYKYDNINNRYIKTLPDPLDISPIALGHWLMGDGSYNNAVILCTDIFTKDEVLKLINYLYYKYNLDSNLLVIKYKLNNNLIIRYRIRFRSNSTHKIRLLIKEHILPEFYYKLGIN